MSDTEKNTSQEEGAKSQEDSTVTRRDFFNEIALGALGIAGLGAATVTYRYLTPNVLFEPATTFRVGNPEIYPPDSVTFREKDQVYIVRTKEGGFFAVSAVCTHLGCITQWKDNVRQIQCPCHGSKFDPNGKKIEGPAPRPLPHYAVTLTADGELQVDRLQEIKPDQIFKV